MVYREKPELERLLKEAGADKPIENKKVVPYVISTSHGDGLIQFEKGHLKNNLVGFGNVMR